MLNSPIIDFFRSGFAPKAAFLAGGFGFGHCVWGCVFDMARKCAVQRVAAAVVELARRGDGIAAGVSPPREQPLASPCPCLGVLAAALVLPWACAVAIPR